MGDGALRITPGELPPGEIIEHLESGRRVIVEREVLGATHEITLRFDGETYYCDTPTTLHRHTTVEGMRSCLDEQRYAGE